MLSIRSDHLCQHSNNIISHFPHCSPSPGVEYCYRSLSLSQQRQVETACSHTALATIGSPLPTCYSLSLSLSLYSTCVTTRYSHYWLPCTEYYSRLLTNVGDFSYCFKINYPYAYDIVCTYIHHSISVHLHMFIWYVYKVLLSIIIFSPFVTVLSGNKLNFLITHNTWRGKIISFPIHISLTPSRYVRLFLFFIIFFPFICTQSWDLDIVTSLPF